jgi:hypothetical protein
MSVTQRVCRVFYDDNRAGVDTSCALPGDVIIRIYGYEEVVVELVSGSENLQGIVSMKYSAGNAGIALLEITACPSDAKNRMVAFYSPLINRAKRTHILSTSCDKDLVKHVPRDIVPHQVVTAANFKNGKLECVLFLFPNFMMSPISCQKIPSQPGYMIQRNGEPINAETDLFDYVFLRNQFTIPVFFILDICDVDREDVAIEGPGTDFSIETLAMCMGFLYVTKNGEHHDLAELCLRGRAWCEAHPCKFVIIGCNVPVKVLREFTSASRTFFRNRAAVVRGLTGRVIDMNPDDDSNVYLAKYLPWNGKPFPEAALEGYLFRRNFREMLPKTQCDKKFEWRPLIGDNTKHGRFDRIRAMLDAKFCRNYERYEIEAAWKGYHHKVVQMALGMASLQLPVYVVFEIFKHVSFEYTLLQEIKVVRAIERVGASYRHVLDQRTVNTLD